MRAACVAKETLSQEGGGGAQGVTPCSRGNETSGGGETRLWAETATHCSCRVAKDAIIAFGERNEELRSLRLSLLDTHPRMSIPYFVHTSVPPTIPCSYLLSLSQLRVQPREPGLPGQLLPRPDDGDEVQQPRADGSGDRCRAQDQHGRRLGHGGEGDGPAAVLPSSATAAAAAGTGLSAGPG